tara:strand:- start:664 stop:1149 length:486 start_codon:yes stop_codon:yes gene_type:complete
MFKIKDNFLDLDQHIILKAILESDNFPWFYTKGKVFKTEKPKLFDYQFNHIFYIDDNINSNHFDRLKPLLEKIDYKSLIRIKANLNPISNKIVEFDSHNDQNFKCKSAIYYVNNNNGFTMIGDDKVESKANRMVFFDSEIKHYGSNATDCNNRMLINFNYF